MERTRTRRAAITAAAVAVLAGGIVAPATAAPSDKVTSTTIEASATTISLGDTVTLSGRVTWDDSGTATVVKDGTVTVMRGDADCNETSLESVGSQDFVNADADNDTPYSIDDTPTAAGSYGYVAVYGGGNHGNGPNGPFYTPSESTCVVVTVTTAELRDAPAWANDYMRSDGFDDAACESQWGSNYHGEVIRRIAQWYEGRSFATWDDADEAGVFADVDAICDGSKI